MKQGTHLAASSLVTGDGSGDGDSDPNAVGGGNGDGETGLELV